MKKNISTLLQKVCIGMILTFVCIVATPIVGHASDVFENITGRPSCDCDYENIYITNTVLFTCFCLFGLILFSGFIQWIYYRTRDEKKKQKGRKIMIISAWIMLSCFIPYFLLNFVDF